jgi:hypothetical protein
MLEVNIVKLIPTSLLPSFSLRFKSFLFFAGHHLKARKRRPKREKVEIRTKDEKAADRK